MGMYVYYKQDFQETSKRDKRGRRVTKDRIVVVT